MRVVISQAVSCLRLLGSALLFCFHSFLFSTSLLKEKKVLLISCKKERPEKFRAGLFKTSSERNWRACSFEREREEERDKEIEIRKE